MAINIDGTFVKRLSEIYGNKYPRPLITAFGTIYCMSQRDFYNDVYLQQ